ncbi:hypothetical protein DFQ27_007851 [Actinomortierella ambigua]|uniref:Uncharacterized protein n=1 Tax=Actinomortierella ambigua TaxID=1343610 RepID=A0A9P6PTP6_9FUNG|nr:hypothetical protein DFQ27_007851 [Actinomortierella ambigua]
MDGSPSLTAADNTDTGSTEADDLDEPPQLEPIPIETPVEEIEEPPTTTTTTTTTTKTPTEPRIPLPTDFVVPPMPPANGGAAPSPVFPPGSDSCQKCRYFYPRLATCNEIANNTLTKIPRAPLDGAHDAIIMQSPPPPLPPLPVNFTTILPLLRCLCPDQGLAATKVCATCFRGTRQPDFLGALAEQNVTSQLSSWQQACLDSGMGQHVPPQGTKGDSAASAVAAAAAKNGATSLSRLVVTVLVFTSCPRFIATFVVASTCWMVVWGILAQLSVV